MDLNTAHGKLITATTALGLKLDALAAFADELTGGTHRVAPRVELDRYGDLCAEIEYAIEEHIQARETFLRVIRGDAE